MNSKSLFALGGCVAFLVGCASNGVKNPHGTNVTQMRGDERGFVAGTGVESQDLVSVADKMARSILNIPEISKAQTTPRVVVLPVVNETRFPIAKDIFNDKIRIELNRNSQGRVRFLARDTMTTLEQERAAKRAGNLTSSSDPKAQEFKGADYFLKGKLQGLSTRTSSGTSDYVLYSFQLVDSRTSEIIWEDAADVKKQGLEDAAYR
ncbi:MAG TPA: penicillin-binding protein activator LpoB [Verrucomicrobiae bacterium]|nr:penicillin-binding protein activator LpoB [Verrucomicrobiae bacterium]